MSKVNFKIGVVQRGYDENEINAISYNLNHIYLQTGILPQIGEKITVRFGAEDITDFLIVDKAYYLTKNFPAILFDLEEVK
jgi:hypothetical protein